MSNIHILKSDINWNKILNDKTIGCKVIHNSESIEIDLLTRKREHQCQVEESLFTTKSMLEYIGKDWCAKGINEILYGRKQHHQLNISPLQQK